MATLTCSVCGGELVAIGKLLRCSKCNREKPRNPREERVQEVDMDENTRDMDVLME